jgi:hypothetical protein
MKKDLEKLGDGAETQIGFQEIPQRRPAFSNSTNIRQWLLPAVVSLGVNAAIWGGFGKHFNGLEGGELSGPPTPEKKTPEQVEVEREQEVLQAVTTYLENKDKYAVNAMPPEDLWKAKLDVVLAAEKLGHQFSSESINEAREIMDKMVKELRELKETEGDEAVNAKRAEWNGVQRGGQNSVVRLLLYGESSCESRALYNAIMDMAVYPDAERKIVDGGGNQYAGHTFVARRKEDGTWLIMDGKNSFVADDDFFKGKSIMGIDNWEASLLSNLGKESMIDKFKKDGGLDLEKKMIPDDRPTVPYEMDEEMLATYKKVMAANSRKGKFLMDIPTPKGLTVRPMSKEAALAALESPKDPPLRKLKYYEFPPGVIAEPVRAGSKYAALDSEALQKLAEDDSVPPLELLDVFTYGGKVVLGMSASELKSFEWFDKYAEEFSEAPLESLNVDGGNDPDFIEGVQRLANMDFIGEDRKGAIVHVENIDQEGGLDFLKTMGGNIFSLKIIDVDDLSGLEGLGERKLEQVHMERFGDATGVSGEIAGSLVEAGKRIILRHGQVDFSAFSGLTLELILLKGVESSTPFGDMEVGSLNVSEANGADVSIDELIRKYGAVRVNSSFLHNEVGVFYCGGRTVAEVLGEKVKAEEEKKAEEARAKAEAESAAIAEAKIAAARVDPDVLRTEMENGKLVLSSPRLNNIDLYVDVLQEAVENQCEVALRLDPRVGVHLDHKDLISRLNITELEIYVEGSQGFLDQLNKFSSLNLRNLKELKVNGLVGLECSDCFDFLSDVKEVEELVLYNISDPSPFVHIGVGKSLALYSVENTGGLREARDVKSLYLDGDTDPSVIHHLEGSKRLILNDFDNPEKLKYLTDFIRNGGMECVAIDGQKYAWPCVLMISGKTHLEQFNGIRNIDALFLDGGIESDTVLTDLEMERLVIGVEGEKTSLRYVEGLRPKRFVFENTKDEPDFGRIFTEVDENGQRETVKEAYKRHLKSPENEVESDPDEKK